MNRRSKPNRYPAVRYFSPRARVRIFIGLAACLAVVLVAAVVVNVAKGSDPPQPVHAVSTVRYLGVYEPGAPGSYIGIDQFAQAIGRQPNIVLYYPPWLGKFQVGFATAAAKRGALTLVQLDTAKNVSLASIASGQYDAYWRSYANEVRAFGGRVILSFDHEMNGDWYPWGYRHTSPAVFVAAWRHIVTIFREQGARNVTWMWTVNVTDDLNDVTAPAAWWPGRSYVNWVGIDGYYYSPSTVFSSLFGSTMVDVRELTHDPILIAETGAAITAGQSTKIIDLFDGIRAFGLLGFVLFDQDGTKETESWRISNPAVFATLRREAEAYMKPPS
jgi:mannan endo-1,4-beta-mannosidase